MTIEEFTERTLMPAADVEQLNALSPRFLELTLREMSSRIDAQLAKRYATPFKNTVPDIVKGWVVRTTTPRAYLRLGINPSDAQFIAAREDEERAWKEIAEAADAQNGLYDLPLRADTSASGIVKTATLAYSEATPYGFLDSQRRRAYGQ